MDLDEDVVRATASSSRLLGLWRGGLLAMAVAVLLDAAPVPGQTVRGYVRDTLGNAPVSGADVAFRGRDGRVSRQVTTDSGFFELDLRELGGYLIDVRRIGYVPIVSRSAEIGAGTNSITLTLERHAVRLDTARTIDSPLSRLTPGSEYVRRHLLLGKGLIISGLEIQTSGLLLSEYLGRLEGVALRRVAPPTTPVLPARNGFLTGDGKSIQCVYGRINRMSPLLVLLQKNRESVDDILDPREIMAVEIYRTVDEIPSEWRAEMLVQDIYMRQNARMRYVIGHAGIPIDYGLVQYDEHKASRLFTSRNHVTLDAPTLGGMGRVQPSNKKFSTVPQCAFLQIWTRVGWDIPS